VRLALALICASGAIHRVLAFRRRNPEGLWWARFADPVLFFAIAGVAAAVRLKAGPTAIAGAFLLALGATVTLVATLAWGIWRSFREASQVLDIEHLDISPLSEGTPAEWSDMLREMESVPLPEYTPAFEAVRAQAFDELSAAVKSGTVVGYAGRSLRALRRILFILSLAPWLLALGVLSLCAGVWLLTMD